MALSAFADRERPPSLDEMLGVVGEKAALWRAVSGFMSETYRCDGERKFYGKSYGWMLWFRVAGKSLLALYPQDGGVTAQITLGPSLVDRALELPLGTAFRRAIEEAHPYPEGRWLFVPLRSDGEVEDLKRLVLLKKRPPRVR
jgi:hypothetical protein